MKIALIGMMGASKTTTGAVLARMLSLPFYDCDDLVEKHAGEKIKEIFARSGAPHFRFLETAQIVRLSKIESGVVALGGGAVLVEQNMRHLKDFCVIWLKASLRETLKRLKTSDERPLALNPTYDMVFKLYRARRPLYEMHSDYEVDTTRKTPDECASECVKFINEFYKVD